MSEAAAAAAAAAAASPLTPPALARLEVRPKAEGRRKDEVSHELIELLRGALARGVSAAPEPLALPLVLPNVDSSTSIESSDAPPWALVVA